ncbi:MAG: energy transducer TonB [Bacteroidota bacterium]
MTQNFNQHIKDERSYRVRFMYSVIIVETIVLLVFNFWPVDEQPNRLCETDFSEGAIALEDIVRTTQQNRPPPPPKPQVPIPEPNDEVIEEDPIEFDNLNISEYSDSLSTELIGSDGESEKPVSSPQSPPQVIHIVEPTVPDAAKQAEIKAEIWVNFLVDTNGRVEEASINEIVLYDPKTNERQTADRIGYGLTEATLNAALQWRFRPARNEGKPVKSYTRQVFSFGF